MKKVIIDLAIMFLTVWAACGIISFITDERRMLKGFINKLPFLWESITEWVIDFFFFIGEFSLYCLGGVAALFLSIKCLIEQAEYNNTNLNWVEREEQKLLNTVFNNTKSEPVVPANKVTEPVVPPAPVAATPAPMDAPTAK